MNNYYIIATSLEHKCMFYGKFPLGGSLSVPSEFCDGQKLAQLTSPNRMERQACSSENESVKCVACVSDESPRPPRIYYTTRVKSKCTSKRLFFIPRATAFEVLNATHVYRYKFSYILLLCVYQVLVYISLWQLP